MKELIFAAIMSAALGVPEQEVENAYEAFARDAGIELIKEEQL